MNALNVEQIESIRNYWKLREKYDKQLNKFIDLQQRECSKYYYCKNENTSANIKRKMDSYGEKIMCVEYKISTLDINYVKMLLGFGLVLYDRTMDEKLFAFINDGDENIF